MPFRDSLKHRYFVLRHGQSEANVQGIIVSNPQIGSSAYGLTDFGAHQVRLSLTQATDAGILSGIVDVVSSPFKRTLETAYEAQSILDIRGSVAVDERLRERWFGDFDLGDAQNYTAVWSEDQRDASHKCWNVESISEVARRVVALVGDLERSDGNKRFLLCTHGDVASVLKCLFLGYPLSEHRQIGSMSPAEFSELTAPV
jgi:broad specificity phosphatase PhoE